jgi:hypothetical protein
MRDTRRSLRTGLPSAARAYTSLRGRLTRLVRCAALLLVALPLARAVLAVPAPPVVQTRLALDHLGQAAIDWQIAFGCSGCHKQPITLAAYATAAANGHDAPRPGVVAALITGTLSGTSGQDANGCFSFAGGGSFTTATTVAGRGLEATDRYLGHPLPANLQAAADCLRPRQAADGRLAADRAENPVAQGDFATTAHGIYVWNRTYERTGVAVYHASAASASAWLRTRISVIEAAPASFTTQDKAMLLAGLGAMGAGTSDPDVARMRALLASSQLPDGSWKIQSANVGGNGYATGLGVYALRQAGVGRGDPVLEGGLAWLLLHELPDGSWDANDWTGGTPSAVAPSMWAALALASFPSPLATLRLSGSAITWTAVEGAEAYDVVRGSVSALLESGSSVPLGPLTCVAPAIPGTSATDGAVPAPGQAFFYVFRIRWANEHDVYGRSSGGRDRVPGFGDCAQ